MAWTLRQEVNRKIFHLSAVFILIAYNYLFNTFGKTTAMFSLLGFLVLVLFHEYLRIDLKLKTPFVKLTRKHEQNTMASSVYFILAIIVCFALFDFKIANIAILITIFSDVIVSLVGGKFKIKGRLMFKTRTVEAVAAAFLVNFAIGYFILPNLLIISTMSIVAILIEILTHKVEDNLSVPIITGLVGQVLLMLL
ncbi:diacylglycerol/polyprenol kinase family protein [Nanoarchaeota archaeon]